VDTVTKGIEDSERQKGRRERLTETEKERRTERDREREQRETERQSRGRQRSIVIPEHEGPVCTVLTYRNLPTPRQKKHH